jgi:hypothetical protein
VLKIEFSLHFDLDPRLLHVRVEGQKVEVEYLETVCPKERPEVEEEAYTVHATSPIHLFSCVVPEETEMAFGPRTVTVTMQKATQVRKKG